MKVNEFFREKLNRVLQQIDSLTERTAELVTAMMEGDHDGER